MSCCPTCGRRRRAHRVNRTEAELPLFAWVPPKPRPTVRLVKLHCLPDPEGMPRPALLLPRNCHGLKIS